MGEPVSNASLFEDPHTDARMRRTIPQFACLGAVAVVVTIPLATPTTSGRLQLLGLAGLAVIVAGVVSWRDLIYRMSRDVILGLLLAYVIIIAFAVVATGDGDSPYRLLYLIPVTFASVFFVGWVRYSLAVAAPLVNFVVVGTFIPVDSSEHVVRLVVFVLLAHFGAVVSETLREALRANRSIHAVLEAASGAPMDSDLTSIGVDAALSVAVWDVGGVMIVNEGNLEGTALRGVSPEVSTYYRTRSQKLSDSLAAPLADQPTILEFPDLEAAVGTSHPLVGEGIVSVVVIPILYRGGLSGILVLGHRSSRRLDNRERHRLTQVADQLGLALGSAAAYRRQHHVADDLRELNRHKDEFLSNVSHELRTPAATIRLIATTLRQSSHRLDDSQRKEMFETLERRASQLTELIGNLLDEALADAGATRLVLSDIDWVEAVIRWADVAALDSGRPVTLRLPETPIYGHGDAVKLERVVVNLLSNAAKFSDPTAPIELTLMSDGDGGARIAVTDHGIGIAPEELALVFDRFHQVDGGATRTVGGFGIGLSLAQHFVTAHGGTIEVVSAPGAGSTFTVHLPRLPTPPAVAELSTEPARTVPG